jgi:hypothetical protein
MARLIVEYNPPISVKTQYLIKNEITPSMISNDETSGQYDVSTVKEKLEYHELDDDLKIIDELIKEGVHYIEI